MTKKQVSTIVCGHCQHAVGHQHHDVALKDICCNGQTRLR
jgi:hypothetical protein